MNKFINNMLNNNSEKLYNIIVESINDKDYKRFCLNSKTLLMNSNNKKIIEKVTDKLNEEGNLKFNSMCSKFLFNASKVYDSNTSDILKGKLNNNINFYDKFKVKDEKKDKSISQKQKVTLNKNIENSFTLSR